MRKPQSLHPKMTKYATLLELIPELSHTRYFHSKYGFL